MLQRGCLLLGLLAAGCAAGGRVTVETYRVNLVQAKSLDELEVQEDQLVGVAPNGTIMFIEAATDAAKVQELQVQYTFARAVASAPPSRFTFVMPGFIDTHVHAPQFYNVGLGYDLELLPWLQKYTFPLEEQFIDATNEKVVQAYRRTVQKTLKQGTTTAAYMGTIHTPATLVLAETMMELGQRGLVGKVNSDTLINTTLDEDTRTSFLQTEQWILDMMALRKSRGQRGALVTPAITPRFAVGTSMELMTLVGGLSRKYNLPVQTHIDESRGEIDLVAEMFSNSSSYAGVYKDAGLFDVPNMILGHCIHNTDEENELILAAKGVGCSHCPLSNYALDSGIAPIRHYTNIGMTVGLGSDVSGGYTSSMLETMRGAVIASKTKWFQNNRTEEWRYFQHYGALWLATQGGAKLVGLENRVGKLAPGYQFDAIAVDVTAEASIMSFSVNEDAGSFGPANTLADMFGKFFYEGDDRNMQTIWVDGQVVVSGGNPVGGSPRPPTTGQNHAIVFRIAVQGVVRAAVLRKLGFLVHGLSDLLGGHGALCVQVCKETVSWHGLWGQSVECGACLEKKGKKDDGRNAHVQSAESEEAGRQVLTIEVNTALNSADAHHIARNVYPHLVQLVLPSATAEVL
eukprot:TRINITY_DN1870_c1_g1_i1.p1 TRINITY_DN1870_c1_g1~~TRINITY_DN1870_c1_g1_i1.p1  ORF type:complete len:629 (+),score=280.83 TRINITY_DN1870_c1_g1_i1:71-1957(+)